MNIDKQQELRQLVEALYHQQPEGSPCRMLAAGTMELLTYTAELEQTLQAVTADCCEAMYLTYESGAKPHLPAPNTSDNRHLVSCVQDEDRAA